MIHLVPAQEEKIKQHFYDFYHKDGWFFFINHDDQEVGVFGVKKIQDPRGVDNVCEISVCVFENFRFNIPYRKILRLVLTYPFSYGFDKILISTVEKSIITLLRQCRSLGVEFIGHDGACPCKVWFKCESTNNKEIPL